MLDRGLSVVFILVGLVMVALALPLIFETVKPNRIYGFRTEKTLSDPDIWYRANRAIGIDLAVAGVVTVTVAAALLLAKAVLSENTVLLINLAVSMSALVVAVVHSSIVMSRL